MMGEKIQRDQILREWSLIGFTLYTNCGGWFHCNIAFSLIDLLFVSEKTKQVVKLDASTVEIEERGVKLRLTVVDTPGYGDAIDNTDCFTAIIKYIDEQFERFLRDESGLNRRNIMDNRVHCCFYFISPMGHG